MHSSAAEKAFENLVEKKFSVYNSLFLNLPYPDISNTGILIPLLVSVCKQALDSGKDPLETLDAFFEIHTQIASEKEKIDFMFRVIQYVERQVVLFDSAEDAAFEELVKLDNSLPFNDHIQILSQKNGKEKVNEKLSSFSARIVFTAHPTQFYPPAVLNIIAKLTKLIKQNDINQIDLSLQQLGMTSLINTKKPSPLDEAKNIMYFLRKVYYDAVADLYARIKNASHNPQFENPDLLQFGFWPGGDRDGNPFVTAPITMAVADELRTTLMKCYYGDLKELEKKLTFKGLEDLIAGLKNELYKAMFNTDVSLKFDEIMTPLSRIKEILVDQYRSLYLDELEKLIDKVKIFRTHFATLDIRQNHSIHLQVIEAVLKQEKCIRQSLDELDKNELKSILLNSRFHLDENCFQDLLVKDTLQNLSQLSIIQNKNGERGCNRYIISNSEDVFSVLFVFSLLRWHAWPDQNIPFDIIPLFESIDGMKHSEAIMRELFEIQDYRHHLKQRQNTQTIMLGFSDGTKDGGYLKANWSIFKTKERLTAVCKEYGIHAIFFDGRGGPPARGGGKTHRFYASQSNRIAGHALQLTIQGQTISSRYGTTEHFTHNFEQLITAGLTHSLSSPENNISNSSRALLETLADLSHEKYLALKNHKMFLPYLEKKSTLKYYGQTNIGSRPAKRGNKSQLEFSDLRAIPFVGSWSQLKQNVPGYYGLGTALYTLASKGRLNDLKNLFSEVPFFRALIQNSAMSLSKSNFKLTAYLAKDSVYKDFWNMLFEEFERTREMIFLISGYQSLMQEEPLAEKSIQIREEIVLPLLVIQQYALQKLESGSEFLKSYETLIRRSLYGNTNASRNSA